MKAILPILLIFMFFPSPARGSESKWLGSYVGSEIPGYEITEATYMEIGDMWTSTAEFNSLALLEKLRKACDYYGGKALVNIRVEIGIGDVSFRNRSSGLKVATDAGLYGVMYADCVVSVKPKKR